MLTAEQEIRFWSYVDKTDGCWLWRGGLGTPGGYGRFSLRAGSKVAGFYAHRIVHTLLVGPVPRGLFVLHTCDVPACVNPAHLFLGTQADNMADKKRKGRAASGDRNGASKLTWPQVRAIRTALHDGKTPTMLAQKYGVHRDLIYMIRSGRIWIEKESSDAN